MKTIYRLLLGIAIIFVMVPLNPQPGQSQGALVCALDVVVQADDWLSKIAEKEYGDPLQYPVIVEATNSKAQSDSSYTAIDTPDLIEPGWKLCLPAQDAGSPESMESASTGLTEIQLANATYSGIYDEPVTLTDGIYEGEPFEEGGVARPVVEYIANSTVYGDLNSDGMADAAVLLVENSGGSGNFSYVGAQLDQAGQPVDGGTSLLGDRTQLISMVIENGQVVAEIVTPGPDEPLCCGTLKVRKTLVLQDGKLAEVGSEELGTVSLDDLMGSSWVLERLNFDQPSLADSGITAVFADGQVTGSAGCNNYSTSLSSDGGQALTVGPIISTRMACPEPEMTREMAYLTALQNATEWSYFPGQLAVTYQNEDGSLGTLFYDPAE
jgi:heat shock protein HslJ